MKTQEITQQQFTEKIANYIQTEGQWKYLGDKPAIVDFYASWCGPCKMVAPILDQLAAQYANDIHIYKVNTEQEQDLAEAFGIRSIPSLLFIPMKGQPQMATGAMSKEQFIKIIEEVLLEIKI